MIRIKKHQILGGTAVLLAVSGATPIVAYSAYVQNIEYLIGGTACALALYVAGILAQMAQKEFEEFTNNSEGDSTGS